MGHHAGKDIYRQLGKKIDASTVRTPGNRVFLDILTELFTEDEARFVVRMPYGPSTFGRLQRGTGYGETRLRKLLDRLTSKGLVVDLPIGNTTRYLAAPFVVGIYEFTMMRTDGGVDQKACSRLFHDYMDGDDSFFRANFAHKEKVSVTRALPHEETISESDFIEVFDYEKASALIEGFDRFSIGFCSCRHKKLHLNEKSCETPLETCSSFGRAADYLIRHGFAKEVSKSEMLENLARSRELGLVLLADNVQRNITFLCHCCGCCCVSLSGISRHGYPNSVVTSSLIADTDDALCNGCGKCARACPISATTLQPDFQGKERKKGRRKKKPVIDKGVCLGCGVCALACETGALKLVRREQRVLHPETTFERIMLQSLERGNLPYQLFDDPQRITHKFMRGFVGGFLRLPLVKRALLSDRLRSSFLSAMKGGAAKQKNAELTEI